MAVGSLTDTFPTSTPQTTERRNEPVNDAVTNPSPLSDPERIGRFLGWFSVGLGAAELLAPRAVAKVAGTREHRVVTRAFGMREIAVGVGIFTQPENPAPWVWARVAGDVLDIASIIGGARRSKRLATLSSLAAVAGVTTVDVLCAQRLSAHAKETQRAERAEASVLIARSPQDIYQFWRNPENHPRFISEDATVTVTGDRQSHWSIQLPRNAGHIDWNAEIVEDVPNERISWRVASVRGLTANGTVTFEPAPADRGTYVRVQLDFDHPGRSVLSTASRLIGKHPEQIIYKSLRRLKSLLETGEIITTEGQSAGRRSGATWLDAIAR